MNPVRNGIIGLVLGDMLDVPPAHRVREYSGTYPAAGPATYDQPKDTWSDGTSLALCLADSLVRGYDLENIAKTLLCW